MLNLYSSFVSNYHCLMRFPNVNFFLWKQMYYGNNPVLLTLSRFVYKQFIAIGNRYGIASMCESDTAIEDAIWALFSSSVVL